MEVTLLLQLSSWLLKLWSLTFIPFESRLYVKCSVLKLLNCLLVKLFCRRQSLFQWEKLFWSWFAFNFLLIYYKSREIQHLKNLQQTWASFGDLSRRIIFWARHFAAILLGNFLSQQRPGHAADAESKNENENHINFDHSTHFVNCSVVRLIEHLCSRLFPLILFL